MSPEEKEQIWQEYMNILPKVIEAQGLCNVVGGIHDHVQTLYWDAESETQREDDLGEALVSLNQCTKDCDLEYK